MATLGEHLPPYKEWPYFGRFVTIIVVGIALNLAGLEGTQLAGWSMLFFDMAGTAFASLLGGAVAGLLVALATGAIGALWLGPQYYLFNVVSITGALLWAVIPRWGRPGLGGDMFDPGSYRRGLINIVSVGTMVGLGCSVIAVVVQSYVLNLKQHMDLHGNLDKYGSIAGSGTVTSANNMVMVRTISDMMAHLGVPKEIPIILSSIVSNVPDKIVATATAVLVIFLFGTLPNFAVQKRISRKNHDKIYRKVIDRRVILFLICAIPMVTEPIAVWHQSKNITSVGIMFVIGFLFLMASVFDQVYLRSFDREIEPEEEAFYDIHPGKDLKIQREVFEDILKVMVVLVSGMSFFLASFGANNIYCSSEDLHGFVGCTALYRLAVVNILILTGYRYMMVLFVRCIGRV